MSSTNADEGVITSDSEHETQNNFVGDGSESEAEVVLPVRLKHGRKKGSHRGPGLGECSRPKVQLRRRQVEGGEMTARNGNPSCDAHGVESVHREDRPAETQLQLPSPAQTDSSASVSVPATPSPVRDAAGSDILAPPYSPPSPTQGRTAGTQTTLQPPATERDQAEIDMFKALADGARSDTVVKVQRKARKAAKAQRREERRAKKSRNRKLQAENKKLKLEVTELKADTLLRRTRNAAGIAWVNVAVGFRNYREIRGGLPAVLEQVGVVRLWRWVHG